MTFTADISALEVYANQIVCLFQQDFKNDKEYLLADMRQMLLTGKVNIKYKTLHAFITTVNNPTVRRLLSDLYQSF